MRQFKKSSPKHPLLGMESPGGKSIPTNMVLEGKCAMLLWMSHT